MALATSAAVALAFTLSAGIVLADTPPLDVTATEYSPDTRELVIDYAGADASLPRVEVDGREVAVADSQRVVTGASGTVVLAIEASSSTAGTLLAQELQYARALVEGLRPGVAVGVVFFGDAVHEEAPTTDRAVVLHALDNPPVGAAAVLYDGVASAAEMLSRAPGPRTMAVLTFGWHFGSQGASRGQSAEAARASGATVHTVALGTDYDITYLNELAGSSGSFQVGANPAQATAIALGAGSASYRLRVPVDLPGGQHTVRVGSGSTTVERAFTSATSPSGAATSSTASSGAATGSAPAPAEAPDGTSSGGLSLLTTTLVALLAAGAAFIGWRKFAAHPGLPEAPAEQTEVSDTSAEAALAALATLELRQAASPIGAVGSLDAIEPLEATAPVAPAPEVTTPLPALASLADLADDLIVPEDAEEAEEADDLADLEGLADLADLGVEPIRFELPALPALPARPAPEVEPSLAALIESFEDAPTPTTVAEDDSITSITSITSVASSAAATPSDERGAVTTPSGLPQPSPAERASAVFAGVGSALSSARATLAARLSGMSLGGVSVRRSTAASNLRPGLASTVEARIRHALQRHALAVLYQPVCDGVTGTLVGGEALLRTEGVLEAGATRAVVREASALGRMPEITALVVPEACRTAAALGAAGSTIPVSLNLSAEQLLDRDFMRLLTASLLEYSVPVGQLALEVPEHALIGNASAIGVLHDASRLGVLIVVDDFWASTSELMGQLPPLHAVKVDVSHGSGSARAAQELRRVMDAAVEAKVTVIAKRVETEADRAFAASLGCELMQGNEFSRAVTSEEFVAMRDGVRVSPPSGGVTQEPPATWDSERRQVA